ncbi:MAG: glycosyltransferase family 39 protein [Caldilineales bacterium]|nr:glycosyltransferase family 39 protein [Caldilineales bacterium]
MNSNPDNLASVSGQQQPRIFRRANLWLILILILAAILRFYRLGSQSFWADEGNSVVLATRSLMQIVSAAAADIHPPAYYLGLKLWGGVFGLGEIGARSFSVVAGILLVWFVYVLGRQLARASAGLIAALLAAVNPFLIYYSQEARMYMLLALCAAVAAYALVMWIQSPDRRKAAGILYVISAVLGLYTHYAFPILLVTLNLVFLLWLWRQRHQSASLLHDSGFWPWLGLQALAILLFAPWLPTAWRQLTTWPNAVASLGSVAGMLETLRLLNCGPTPCQLSPLLVGFELALVVLALLPLQKLSITNWLGRWLPLVWLIMPLAAMLIFGIFTPTFSKFLVIIVAPYVLLLAMGVVALALAIARPVPGDSGIGRNRISAVIMIVITGLLALSAIPSLNHYYHDPTVARDDYRSIAAYLKAIAGPHDAVILNAPGQIDAFNQYDHGPAQLYTLPSSRPPDPAATKAELDQINASADHIYVIYWATEQSDPENIVATHLAETAFKAWDTWAGNLKFSSYSAQDSPEPATFPDPLRFGDSILLEASGISSDPLQPGDIARALLRWSATTPLSNNYKITLQLLDPANQIVAQIDSEPVGGARPTSTWQPDETIDDPYGLPIPLATPPGVYPLILAVYDAESGVRLPIATSGGISDALTVGRIVVIPPVAAPPTAVLPIRLPDPAQRGPITFLGHDRFKQGFGHAPETPIHAGDQLHLTTFWQIDQELDADYQFDLLIDNRRLGRFPLAGPAYPTSRWLPGLPWRGEHSAALPADLSPGEHQLSIAIVAPDGAIVGDAITLPPLKVE